MAGRPGCRQTSSGVLARTRVMRRERLTLRAGFHVGITRRGVQAATMVLTPGSAEGAPGNRHRGADQWLYVISGSGVARVNGRRVALRTGTLLLIERGDIHTVKNTGRGLLKTLNFYVPPAYRRDGSPLPRGRASRAGSGSKR
jgi:mannose-6-phosphate isomerase-like protein (cupin superfamily)